MREDFSSITSAERLMQKIVEEMWAEGRLIWGMQNGEEVWKSTECATPEEIQVSNAEYIRRHRPLSPCGGAA